MNSEQIIVRARTMAELEKARDTGIYHGKYKIVSAEAVQDEIARREKLTRGQKLFNFA